MNTIWRKRDTMRKCSRQLCQTGWTCVRPGGLTSDRHSSSCGSNLGISPAARVLIVAVLAEAGTEA